MGYVGVDVLGAAALHAASFHCRTWVAILLAAVAATLFIFGLLECIGYGAEGAAEDAGAHVPEGDRQLVQTCIMLAIELYLLPRLYDAVAVSRDEAMYRRIAAVAHEQPEAKRLVAVVGAAHANGILTRVRGRGL
eukprot:NODE_6962_length_471_cov_176.750000.p3 GENE.NODE_6962_length_471_cov_176.750000~~NODE_6962_length_471_cov_176.750000.p3  ORF type:complete len:135 (+),score=55.17 NODE_6962_length_471_cov_176.750000:3-407(+)